MNIALVLAGISTIYSTCSPWYTQRLLTIPAGESKLLVQKKDAQEKYYHYRDYQKELDTVCTNIHSALGQQHTRPARKQEREEIS